MRKETIGKIATDLQNSDSSTINPQEIQRAQEKEYLDNLIWSVKHARKEVDCSHIESHDKCVDRNALEGDFFIVAILKKEPLLENVLRNYFIPTVDCPTPTYDQTVYRYKSSKSDIEFLWVIPDRETCLTLKENKAIVVPGERSLLQFVLDFYDGTLYRLAKKLNGESKFAGNLLESQLIKGI